jgi:hypothetical protein
MRSSHKVWTTLVLLAGLGLTLTAEARATVIVSPSSTFFVGIGGTTAAGQTPGRGNLFDQSAGIGFRRGGPGGYDPIAPGTPREAWGVSAGATFGVIDPALSMSTTNIVPVVPAGGIPAGPVLGAGVPLMAQFALQPAGGGPNILLITQTYSFVPDQLGQINQNVLRIAHTIQNVSAVSQAVTFRRLVDWDTDPSFINDVNEFPNVGPTFPAPISNAPGFGMGPNPFVDLQSANPLIPLTTSVGSMGGMFGPADLGMAFTLDLGTLAPGGTADFNVFYAISRDTTQNRFMLRDQLLAIDPALIGGIPIGYVAIQGNTLNANSAALGLQFTPVGFVIPEPGSIALLGLGALGLVGYVWRRRKVAA